MIHKKDFNLYLKKKRVIIVGSAGYLQGKGLGEWIDSHDIVVRCNQGYEIQNTKDYGSRTDILYINSPITRRIDDKQVEDWVNHKVNIVVLKSNKGSGRVLSKEPYLLNKINYICLDSKLKNEIKEYTNNKMPNTGIAGMVHLLTSNLKELNVVGFDFFMSGYYSGYNGYVGERAENKKNDDKAHDTHGQMVYLDNIKHDRLKFDEMLTAILDGELNKKVIAVIPARYGSTRLPGKPLADINGKPMIWHVYNKVKKIKEFSDVIVATDDVRIEDICKKYNVNTILTSSKHSNHINRVHEVSEKVKADYYVCINGDEPLIDYNAIKSILSGKNEFYTNLMTEIKEDVDNPARIKVITDANGYGIYMSRGVIPYLKTDKKVKYYKYVGVEKFTKKSLDFFVNTPMGKLERIEDIDHLRFIENGKSIKFIEVESDNLSVDTQKDLDYVREIIKNENS